jgi:predicted metal-dependent phosphotriesterase family hydrolase
MSADNVLIFSDLGQSGNMVHPDGLEAAVAAMKKEGVRDADIDTMMRKNPAKLFGLAG